MPNGVNLTSSNLSGCDSFSEETLVEEFAIDFDRSPVLGNLTR